jgi:hypothetical protein
VLFPEHFVGKIDEIGRGGVVTGERLRQHLIKKLKAKDKNSTVFKLFLCGTLYAAYRQPIWAKYR